MSPLPPVPGFVSTPHLTPPTKKIVRASQEFEAVLLNTLLGSLEQSFSAMPGKKLETGSDHYHYLGMQTLASSLAAGGGLGIADRIVRSLRMSEDSGTHAT
ncbi:MAG: hypothetical protein LAO09_14495 [Acidobacteriia bacterium]|nr:hypothetical protein [Terriglobia bacterium]